MIGLPRVHHRTTDSTNARARELAAAGAPHGTLVTADAQTAGRGRQGRTWVAAPGDALLMSLVVRDLSPILPLAAAVAIAEAAEALAPGADVAIKWPNDVWLERRKLSGILVEGRPQDGWAVLGIGLNVRTREFPAELRAIATSLALAGADVSTGEALAELLGTLERWLAADPAQVLAAWSERDALLGEGIRWDGGSGTAAGVDDSGALLVDLGDGERVALHAGEVHLRRS
ncbi:MAG: BirA family transcriptional regulator [Thermoleophilaceae bacterium]|nr:BirA family transcriptional regulator [Thermoleophilaceae bacterium]